MLTTDNFEKARIIIKKYKSHKMPLLRDKRFDVFVSLLLSMLSLCEVSLNTFYILHILLNIAFKHCSTSQKLFVKLPCLFCLPPCFNSVFLFGAMSHVPSPNIRQTTPLLCLPQRFAPLSLLLWTCIAQTGISLWNSRPKPSFFGLSRFQQLRSFLSFYFFIPVLLHFLIFVNMIWGLNYDII